MAGLALKSVYQACQKVLGLILEPFKWMWISEVREKSLWKAWEIQSEKCLTQTE